MNLETCETWSSQNFCYWQTFSHYFWSPQSTQSNKTDGLPNHVISNLTSFMLLYHFYKFASFMSIEFWCNHSIFRITHFNCNKILYILNEVMQKNMYDILFHSFRQNMYLDTWKEWATLYYMVTFFFFCFPSSRSHTDQGPTLTWKGVSYHEPKLVSYSFITWTTSASSPNFFFFFFFKVEIFLPLEMYTYVVTACLILIATST